MTESPQRSMNQDIKTKSRSSAEEKAAVETAATSRESHDNESKARSSDGTKKGVTSMHPVDGHGFEERDAARALADLSHVAAPSSLSKEDVGRPPPPPPLDGTRFKRVSDDSRESSSQPSPLPGDVTSDGGKGGLEGAAAASGEGGQAILHNHIDVAGRNNRNGPNPFSSRKRPAQRWDSSSSNSSNTTNSTDGSPRKTTDDPSGESSSMSDGGYDGGKSGSNSSDRGGSGSSEEDGELNTNAGGNERARYFEGPGQRQGHARGPHSHGHGNYHGQSHGQVALQEAKRNKKVSISLGNVYVRGEDDADDRVHNYDDCDEDDDDDEEMDRDEDARVNESESNSASEKVGYISSSMGSSNMENGSEKGEKSETTTTTNATNVTSETASTVNEPASDVGKTHAVNGSSHGKVMGKTKTIPVKAKTKSKSKANMSKKVRVANVTASGNGTNDNAHYPRKNNGHISKTKTNATSSSLVTMDGASDPQVSAKIKGGCSSITSNTSNNNKGNSTHGGSASSSASAAATNRRDHDATVSSNSTAGASKSDSSASGSAAAKLMPADMILRPAPYFYYVDHSNEPDEDPLEPLTPASRVPTFPSKMMALLTRQDLSSIICWMSHGRSWRIINPREFELRVIPLYFEHSKFSSFIRQAKGWGFRRLSEGGHKNCYYNEYFLRGLPHLIKKMPRPGASKKFDLDPNHEPDLLKISLEHPVPSHLSPDDLYASTLEAINDCILEGGPKARLPIVHISLASKRNGNASMQTFASILDRGKQAEQQKQQQQGAGLNGADDSSSDHCQKRTWSWSTSTSSVATKRQKGNTTNGASCYPSDPTYSFSVVAKNTGINENDMPKDFDSTSSTMSLRLPMSQNDNGSGNMNLNANSAVNSALNALLHYNEAQQQQRQQQQRQEQAMTPVDQSMTRQQQSIFQQQHQQLHQQPQPPHQTELQRQHSQLLQQQRLQLEQFQILRQQQSDESMQQEQQIRRMQRLQEQQQQIAAAAAGQRRQEKEQRNHLQQQQQSLINEIISSLGLRPSQDQDQQQRQQPITEVPVSAPSSQSHSQQMPQNDANSNASANLLAALYSQQQQQQLEQQSSSTNNFTPQPPFTLQALLPLLQQRSEQQLQQSQTSTNQTPTPGVNQNNTMLGNPSVQENQNTFAKAYLENLLMSHLSGMNQPQHNNNDNNENNQQQQQQQQQQQLQNRQEQQSSNHSLAAVASRFQQQLLAHQQQLQQQQHQHHQQPMRPYQSPVHHTQPQQQSPHLSQVGSDNLTLPKQQVQTQSQQQQQPQQQAPFNPQANERLRDMILQAVAAGAQLGAEAITRSNNDWTTSPSSNQYGSTYFGPNGAGGGRGWNNNSNGGMPPNQR